MKFLAQDIEAQSDIVLRLVTLESDFNVPRTGHKLCGKHVNYAMNT